MSARTPCARCGWYPKHHPGGRDESAYACAKHTRPAPLWLRALNRVVERLAR